MSIRISVKDEYGNEYSIVSESVTCDDVMYEFSKLMMAMFCEDNVLESLDWLNDEFKHLRRYDEQDKDTVI